MEKFITFNFIKCIQLGCLGQDKIPAEGKRKDMVLKQETYFTLKCGYFTRYFFILYLSEGYDEANIVFVVHPKIIEKQLIGVDF